MKRTLSIEIKGKHKLWSFPFKGDPKYLQEWIDDGLNVSVIENTIPERIVGLGMTRLWCRAQDAWNFLRFW